ncbi:AAA family ATPase [Desulfocurvibacter africanus]|uniref:AAA family ATPase n=1 Tax=Desulfocurvibacter africanus TaxID=873 RepID=UPI00041C1685|nr:AAA family ATPase [Desulfocurvibacter africanus]
MRLVIMQGLPGSGKSRVVARDYKGLQVVCLDDIRLALGQVFNPATETMVLAIAEASVRSHLIGGRDVVVDDTHTSARNVMRWVRMGREHAAGVVLHRIVCDLEVCVRRRAGTAVTREHIERMDRNLMLERVTRDVFDLVIEEEG